MQITQQFTKWLRLALSVTVLAGVLTGCGYNDFQSLDETTKSGPVGLRDSKLLAPAARQELLALTPWDYTGKAGELARRIYDAFHGEG